MVCKIMSITTSQPQNMTHNAASHNIHSDVTILNYDERIVHHNRIL